MKAKILQALKTKYSNLGFGEKAFDGVADYLSKTVTEETKIDEAISGVESLLKAFQGDIDKVRNEKSTMQKELDELKKSKGGNSATEEKTKEENEDAPAWAKSLIEQNKTLAERVNQLSGERIAETRKKQFESILDGLTDKQKSSFISDFGRLKFEDDNDFNSYIEEKKTTIGELVQENANAGLSKLPKPLGGGQSQTEETAFIKVMEDINKTEQQK